MADRQRIPRVVWIVTALGFTLMMLYATLFPTYRAPDEPEHVDLVISMSHRFSYPSYDGLRLSTRTVEAQRLASFGYRELTATDIEMRSDRLSFDELGADKASDRANRMPQHPPLYYAITGTFLRIADALGADALSYDATVWLLRVFTALTVAGLPALAYLTTVRLSGSATAGVAASIVPLAIPQLMHIGSSVNNDGLLILLSAWLTLLVAQVLRNDWTSRTAALIGLATGLALITKAFALVFPIWVVVLYAMTWRRGMRWQTAATRVAQVALVSFVAGGWWWARNFVELGRLQASLPAYESVPNVVTQPVWWAGRFAVWITDSFWGWMGWFEAKLPLLLIGSATLIVLATVLLALINVRDRIAIRRSEVVFLLSPVVLIGAIVVQRAYAVYADTGITRGIQGRYFFPLVTALAAVLAATWVGTFASHSRFIPPAVLGGAAVMQAGAVVVIVRTYYGSVGGGLRYRVDSWLAWSPVPTWVSIAIVVGVVGFGVAAAIGLVRRDTDAAGAS